MQTVQNMKHRLHTRLFSLISAYILDIVFDILSHNLAQCPERIQRSITVRTF